jgi:ArsR family metal-binding transcriptional regulator
MELITTFPAQEEFDKAKAVLDATGLPYSTISPDPGYRRVGITAIVASEETRRELARRGSEIVFGSGWIDYYPAKKSVPQEKPPEYENDVFGRTAVMVLQPCAADETKLRAIAHISGDLAEVFPYLNAISSDVFYNVNGQTFTVTEAHRIVTLYPRRIAMAKADDIVDLWRVLETLRVRFNKCWLNRASITPSSTLRKRPPAIEIYYRLPKLNCTQCGQKTCMAFALTLWSGQTALTLCKPVFGGEYGHLRDALVEICAGLGVDKEKEEHDK